MGRIDGFWLASDIVWSCDQAPRLPGSVRLRQKQVGYQRQVVRVCANQTCVCSYGTPIWTFQTTKSGIPRSGLSLIGRRGVGNNSRTEFAGVRRGACGKITVVIENQSAATGLWMVNSQGFLCRSTAENRKGDGGMGPAGFGHTWADHHVTCTITG